MPDTPTPRLALYKSLPDGSEDVSYPLDLGGNWDRIDLATGFLACTSTTRPSAPYNGQGIRETNTGRLWVSNGSAPASGSWSEICTPGTLQRFTGGVANVGALTTAVVNAAFATGDTNNRWQITAGGAQAWGPGNGAVDTALSRTGAGALTVGGTIAADNYKILMPWTKLVNLGAFQSGFAASATTIPCMQKIVRDGIEVWQFKGSITISTTLTAGTDFNAYKFTSSANTPANEHQRQLSGSSSGRYAVRTGFLPSANGSWITLSVPSAAGNGTSTVWLDCEIKDPLNAVAGL